jgi:hypothetical protein
MKIRLPELEDYPWFPKKLRSMQMDYIGWLVKVFKLYQPLVPKINILSSNQNVWVDLCSGSGMPVESIKNKIQGIQQIVLTDLYPDSQNKSDDFTWIDRSINATAPFDQVGFRTMFNAFHHFTNADKVKVLKNHAPHGILIAEILEPNLFNAIKILFTTTIGQFLLRPFVKPFSIAGIIFTYLIPINLITVSWDGLASVLKSSTEKELKTLALEAFPTGYTIETGKVGRFGMQVVYLLIKPIK